MSDPDLTPIYNQLAQEHESHTGVFTSADPLDTSVPLPVEPDPVIAVEEVDPVVGNPSS
jgi:hypothetical protein